MRTLFGIGLILALACGATAADEKFDAKKLIGKWEPKSPKKGEEYTMEFAKDGKLLVSGDVDGKKQTFDGTYKLTDNKLAFTLKVKKPDGKVEEVKETVTLLKLTDDEMEGKDKDGKVETLKKVKPKEKK